MSHLRLTAEQLDAIVKKSRARNVGLIDKPTRKSEPTPKTGRKPRKIVPSEHEEQSAVINWWWRYSHEHGLEERLLFAIPNGANKSMAAAAKFKREGLRAGVPDLMLARPRGDFNLSNPPRGHFKYGALMIEMKRIGGDKPTQAQQEYHALLQAQGYSVLTCFGADEAISAITEYLQN